MKELIKYAGIILVLAGAAILAIPQFMGCMTNALLGSGLITIIIGIIAHIVINRKMD